MKQMIKLSGIAMLIVVLMCNNVNAELIDKNAITIASINMDVPVYKQGSPSPWCDDQLGDCSETIGSAGCAITSVAMVFKYYGVQTDPGDLNDWLKQNDGYVDGCLIVWSVAAGQSDGTVQWAGDDYTGLNQINSELDNGYPVITKVSLSGSSHFVVITGYSESTYYINDPWYGDQSTINDRYGDPASAILGVRFYHGTAANTPIPLSGDLNGNGIDSNGTFDPTAATFTFNGKTVNFGTITDLPVIGDWDNDGKDEIGLFRPDESGQSLFYLLTTDWDLLSESVGSADKTIPFEYYPINIPIAGDWDGDGDDDIGGFDPGNNNFYLYQLNLESESVTSYKDVTFGVSGDKPIIGDWDGDGDDDIGVSREFDSDYENNLVFYFDLDLSGNQSDLTPISLGDNGDVGVIGDWDNDGDDDVGLYREEVFLIDPDFNVPHDLVYLTNGIVKVGVDLQWGGAVSVIMHQGMNLIDNHDTGRLAQVAFYNDDTGTWDPVQGGDKFNQGSPVLNYNIGTNLIYTKTQPRDWRTGVLTDTYVEQWISLEGQSVKAQYKFTHFGTDTYTFHDQEFPCAYINTQLYRLITYTSSNPWTNAGVNEFSIPQTDPGTPNTEFYPTEYWASFVNDLGFGLTLYNPDHISKWAAHRFTIDTKPGYLVTVDQFLIEPGTVEETTEYYIAGNYPDARNIVYSLESTSNQPPTAIIDSITPNPAEQVTDTITFTGHGTDSDGSVTAWNWMSSIDGQLSTSNSFSLPASDLSVGTHTIYYKVQDNDGAWSTGDTEVLTINSFGLSVITVDDDGSADYNTIQAAVDAASTGDTIYVYNGRYYENIIISKSLTLSGQNKDNVIIDGNGSGNCVQLSSSDVIVNGFSITNASGYGIYALYSNLEIENVAIINNSNSGVFFYSGMSFTGQNSVIDGNGGGIIYGGNAATGDAVVEDNIITSNIGSGVSISLTEGKSASVANNKIDNNAGGSSDGIHVSIAGSGGLMTIENNPVTKSGRHGIYLRGVRTGSNVANFSVLNSGGVGLYASSSDLNIENVTITDNANHGIYLYYGKTFTIRNSVIDGNSGGIIYGGNAATGDAVVEDNIINNNIGSGVLISLTEGKSATVANNRIDNNAGGSSDGIYVSIAGSGGVMTIENNPVTKSGRHGIYLRGVRTGSNVANFSVQSSGGVGLYAVSSDLNLENVTITDNTNHGIYFYYGKAFTIRNSTIDESGGGIIYGGNAATGDAVVEDNIITNNIGSGVSISLTEGKSATIANNKIDNNAGGSSDGIYVYIAGSGGVMTIENNPVTRSGRHGIYLRGVRTGSTVADFSVRNSGGVGLCAVSSDLNLENVTITDNTNHGIYFYCGKAFTIRNSTIDGNGGGIIYGGNVATGDAVVEDNIITNNIGSGVSINLVEGKSATVANNKIDNNAGGSSDGIYVYIAGSGGVMTIENNPVTRSGRHGIYLRGVRTGSTVADFSVQSSGGVGLCAVSSDLNLENVTITDNTNHGIYFYCGKAFTIRNSTIDGNGGGIIYGGNVATGDAVVEDNIITNNIGSGVSINLVEGWSATIKNNKIDNNVGSSSDGIYCKIAGTGGVVAIENNSVTNSGDDGIYLTGAKNSVLVNNNILTNAYGIRLSSSSSNLIYHNNFKNNLNYNAYDNGESNSWDNGYPSGGNYWKDYNGDDLDNDSIGDTPYNISGTAGARDQYPLMEPWIGITDPDTTAPVITIDPVTTPTDITTQIITGTFIETGSGIASITVNSVVATISGTAYSATIILSEGLNIVTVVATDNAGNQNTTTATIDLVSTWIESLSIGSASAPVNSIVTIPVSVTNVTNISGISFDLFYNSSIVAVSSVSSSENFIGSSITLNIDNANGTTGIVLTNSNLISASAETPVIDIAFHITGESGSSTSLDLQNVEFSEAGFNPYTPAVVLDGMITVGIKGDLNNNGRVDIGDVAKVAFMVAGKVPEDLNADFNGNGRVDIGDAAKIAFYLAGKVSEL